LEKTILLVEDNQKILYNLNLLLEFNGYKPIITMNGEESLDILSNLETTPDLILYDILLPKTGSYDFKRKYLKNPIEILFLLFNLHFDLPENMYYLVRN